MTHAQVLTPVAQKYNFFFKSVHLDLSKIVYFLEFLAFC